MINPRVRSLPKDHIDTVVSIWSLGNRQIAHRSHDALCGYDESDGLFLRGVVLKYRYDKENEP